VISGTYPLFINGSNQIVQNGAMPTGMVYPNPFITSVPSSQGTSMLQLNGFNEIVQYNELPGGATLNNPYLVGAPSSTGTTILMNNGSNEIVQNTTLPSSLVIPSPQINGTISSSGNLGISAPVTMFGNSSSQFAVTNATGTNVLNCNGSALSVNTHSVTVDDGSGNLLAPNIYAHDFNLNTYSAQYTNVVSSQYYGNTSAGSGTFFAWAFQPAVTTSGTAYVVTARFVAYGTSNNSLAYSGDSTCGVYYSGTTLSFISTAPTFSYTNSGLTPSPVWTISGNILRLQFSQNGGQGYNFTIYYSYFGVNN